MTAVDAQALGRVLAEFSAAKGGYVKSRSGWLSDRTVCYLASGKPALVQSTGLEEHLPVGEGLLTFSTPEEALAERHFDARVLLADFLERSGLAQPRRAI